VLTVKTVGQSCEMIGQTRRAPREGQTPQDDRRGAGVEHLRLESVGHPGPSSRIGFRPVVSIQTTEDMQISRRDPAAAPA
jgi:hypothetical protein